MRDGHSRVAARVHWSSDRDRQRALALVELPAKDLVTDVAEVDAPVMQQMAQ
jgi:hypothetical protein